MCTPSILSPVITSLYERERRLVSSRMLFCLVDNSITLVFPVFNNIPFCFMLSNDQELIQSDPTS